jgi:hypothetical protein
MSGGTTLKSLPVQAFGARITSDDLFFFFFFFLNPVYCPSRRGLTLDFTLWYATPSDDLRLLLTVTQSSSASRI